MTDDSTHDICEICRAEYSKEDWGIGGAHDIRISENGLYYYDSQLGWEGIKINFCPWCGRCLREEGENG